MDDDVNREATASRPGGKLEHVTNTPHGYGIYREPNGAGGHRYWSDAIGGGVMVWDTCLASEDELLTCMVEERRRIEAERREAVLQKLAEQRLP